MAILAIRKELVVLKPHKLYIYAQQIFYKLFPKGKKSFGKDLKVGWAS